MRCRPEQMDSNPEVSMDVTGKAKSLPENAYRQLKPGEEFVPVVPANKIVPELTGYSLFWGLFYAVLFSAACAYLGLKIGQVFEAAEFIRRLFLEEAQ